MRICVKFKDIKEISKINYGQKSIRRDLTHLVAATLAALRVDLESREARYATKMKILGPKVVVQGHRS